AVDGQPGLVSLRGFIADPACERGTAKMQYLFVNGRWIRDRSLGHAVQEGYRGLLMTARYAVAFLFLELPPDQVDVNVHPTKSEVRFRDASALYHLVLAAVRDRLRQANLTPRMMPPRDGVDSRRAGGVSPLVHLAPPGASEVDQGAYAPRSPEPAPDHLPWDLPPVPPVAYTPGSPPAPVAPGSPALK